MAPPLADRLRSRAQRALERAEQHRVGEPVIDVGRRMGTEFVNDRVTGLAAAGAGLVTVAFRTYLRLAGGSNVVVGAVGGVLTAVLWIYLMAIVVLVGAELNDALAARHRLRRSDQDELGDAAGIADRLELGAPGAPQDVGEPGG